MSGRATADMDREMRRLASLSIAAVAWVVLSFQQAPVQGLLALLGALVGYFFWILYCRVVSKYLRLCSA